MTFQQARNDDRSQPHICVLREEMLRTLDAAGAHVVVIALIGSRSEALLGHGSRIRTSDCLSALTASYRDSRVRPDSDYDFLVLTCESCSRTALDHDALEHLLRQAVSCHRARRGHDLDVFVRPLRPLQDGAIKLFVGRHNDACVHGRVGAAAPTPAAVPCTGPCPLTSASPLVQRADDGRNDVGESKLEPRRSVRGYSANVLRELADDLRSCVLNVPYDSAAPVLATQPQRGVPAVSGNCIHQTAELTRSLLRHFPEAEVRYFRDGRHHAVLFRLGKLSWLYLDPYLMQLVPVPIVADGRTRGAVSAPRIDGRFARTSVRLRGSRLTVSKEIPRGHTDYFMTHRFEADLRDSLIERLPDANEREIAFHPEVTTLSVRVVTATFTVNSLVYSLSERSEYGLDDHFQRIYPSDRRFVPFREELAKHVCREGQALSAYLDLACAVYDAETAGSAIEFVFPNSINGGDPKTPQRQERWQRVSRGA